MNSVLIPMTCVTLAMFLAALGQTTIATALPVIADDLGGFDRYVWVVTAYMITATVATPIAGGLSDRYGRKLFLLAGLALFIASSLLLGVSDSMNAVIASRAVQGIGGGLMMVTSLSAVADLFPPEERGKYQGALAGVYAVAALVGPILGGYVTHHYGWQWVFLLNVPTAVPIAALTAWTFPNSKSRVDAAIMPLALYRDRAVVSVLMVVFLTGFVLYGSLVFLPLFFQRELEISVIGSGELLIPILLGIVFGAILSGQLLSRTGGHSRIQILASTGLTAVGMYLVSTMNETTGGGLIAAYLALTGIGLGGTLAVASTVVQNAVPFEFVGASTSASQFWRTVGGMAGLSLAGAALGNAFIVLTAVAVLSIAVAWFLDSQTRGVEDYAEIR